MASALWVADALFAVAQAGIDGVNLHSYPGLSNTLFNFSHSSHGWEGSVNPLYYGALLFADAAPAGSRLLGITTGTTPSLRTWATAGPGRVVRVLLINDSLADRASAAVQPPPGFGSERADVMRLSAPSAYATKDVTLGGRSFGRETTTGVLPHPVPESVAPQAGVYHVHLRPATAVLVTFRR
jgi:hypothetical protein